MNLLEDLAWPRTRHEVLNSSGGEISGFDHCGKAYSADDRSPALGPDPKSKGHYAENNEIIRRSEEPHELIEPRPAPR